MIRLGDFKPDPKPEKKEKKRKLGKTDKLLLEEQAYMIMARRFLDGKECAVCVDRPASQVHHKKGRHGYADEWAFEQEISLLHDQRFWLPVCPQCHRRIEENPAWAYEREYSLTRTDIIV
jgi:hypothetical protein